MSATLVVPSAATSARDSSSPSETRAVVAGLRAKLASQPRPLSLLDFFDANGSDRFDLAALAESYSVSLATAYR